MKHKLFATVGLLVICSGITSGQPRSRALLKPEASIPLSGVQGRIDHLAIDVPGQRLFVAALGNNSLEVIDLRAKMRIRTVPGLAEPQGIVYVPGANRVFVANGGDGSVRSFDAISWKVLKSIPFGADADNLRTDSVTGRVWLGYGAGAVAEFDLEGRKLGEVKLDAHPESFQIEKNGTRIFVNVPKSRNIAVIDRRDRRVAGAWEIGALSANYPMALDEADHRLFVATRSPARLVVLDTGDGRRVATLPVTGDCDDVFFDERRHRIYAIGGEGAVSVFEQQDPNRYAELGQVKTVPGARTGLFSPDLDRLYVAVRKHESYAAEIRVYAPVP